MTWEKGSSETENKNMKNFKVTQSDRRPNHFIATYWKGDECYSVSAYTDDTGTIQHGQLAGPRKTQRLDLDRHAAMVTLIQNQIGA